MAGPRPVSGTASRAIPLLSNLSVKNGRQIGDATAAYWHRYSPDRISSLPQSEAQTSSLSTVRSIIVSLPRNSRFETKAPIDGSDCLASSPDSIELHSFLFTFFQNPPPQPTADFTYGSCEAQGRSSSHIIALPPFPPARLGLFPVLRKEVAVPATMTRSIVALRCSIRVLLLIRPIKGENLSPKNMILFHLRKKALHRLEGAGMQLGGGTGRKMERDRTGWRKQWGH